MRKTFCTALMLATLLPSSPVPAAGTECARSYEFSVLTTTGFRFRELSQDRVELGGRLHLRALPPQRGWGERGHGWWALQLDRTELKSADRAERDEDYHHPFALRRTADGLIAEFRFDSSLPEEVRTKLSGFAYLLQFRSEPVTTTVRERDLLGTYTARYASAEGRITRRKLEYAASASGESGSANLTAISVLGSTAEYQPSSCWLDGLRAEESLRFETGARGFDLVTRQVVAVQRLPEAQLTGSLAELPDQLEAWRVAPAVAPPLDDAARRRLAERLRQGLEARADALPGSTELREWLREFEPVLDSLHALIAAGTFDDTLEKRLLLSLGLLDTPASQRLLADLIEDRSLSEARRFRAIRALVQGDRALAESVIADLDRLLVAGGGLGDPVLDDALLLAVGTLIGMRSGQPGIDDLEGRLVDRLAYADDRERAQVIASLGNTGHAVHVERVGDYRTSASDDVRRRVAGALGQFGGEKAGDLLDGMLIVEPRDEVRMSIIEALGRQPLQAETVTRLFEHAGGSRNPKVRLAAVKAIGAQPANRQTQQRLKALLPGETTRRNYEAIVRAIVRHGEAGRDFQETAGTPRP